MMFSDPSTLPKNPKEDTFEGLGKQIKKLIDESLISLHGFDEDFKIKIEIEKEWEKVK